MVELDLISADGLNLIARIAGFTACMLHDWRCLLINMKVCDGTRCEIATYEKDRLYTVRGLA